ncbi:hypothetical protein BJ912DRAFT_1099566 [Pholiota molesta]|nr:hypothetical protein BJ912DRAFT_1099566 [Pholiota molesta]
MSTSNEIPKSERQDRRRIAGGQGEAGEETEVARVPGLKIRTNDQAPPTPLQAVVRPKEKAQQIREAIKSALSRQKDLDHHWEGSCRQPLPNASHVLCIRTLQVYPPHTAPFLLGLVVDCPPARAVSMRVDWSRRRRILLDAVSRRITPKLPRSSLFGLPENDEDKNMDVDDPAEAERLKRLEEQWKYDADDVPPVGPEGADEQSRMLVGHYDPNYLRHTGYSNGASPIPQAEVNNEMSVNGLPVWPKSQNLHTNITKTYDASHGCQGHSSSWSSQRLYACRAEWNEHEYQLAAGANMNLKLPAARQLQWMSSPMQRPASVVNGIDGQMNGIHVASPNVVYAVPVRSPSGLRQMAKDPLRTISAPDPWPGPLRHNADSTPCDCEAPAMLDDALNTILRPAGGAYLDAGRRSQSNAPRPNSNGLRGSQAAPPPTTLRKNIAAEDGDDGAHTRRSRSSPATTCGQRRQTGGQRRHHSHIENDVPTRTIYGHRSVVANETTTLDMDRRLTASSTSRLSGRHRNPSGERPIFRSPGALSMGTTPRRSHAERPPRRCQLCVAPLVSPPLSVMLTADSYPTLRRRDDTTTATENCVCEIRTPEQSRQQGDDAGMEMTTLDTGWTTHGVAWMERLVLRGRGRREHRCAAAGNVALNSRAPTFIQRRAAGCLGGADHTAARLAVRVLPAPLSSAVSWHTGGMGADVPYRRRGIDSRPLPLPPMRSLRRLAIQGDTEKRSPAEERNF